MNIISALRSGIWLNANIRVKTKPLGGLSKSTPTKTEFKAKKH